MADGGWRPYFDPEYESLSLRINQPRVRVDNSSCPDCTIIKACHLLSLLIKFPSWCSSMVIQVDSVSKPGTLLEVVQLLSDLELTINKAHISSDGSWFMDVFHVANKQGTKILDRKLIQSIEMALGPRSIGGGGRHGDGQTPNSMAVSNLTAIELTGGDRPGLLSEILAILHTLRCNVLALEGWAHGRRAAVVIHVDDEAAGGAIEDPTRLAAMEKQLRNVLGGGEDGARTVISIGGLSVDRRLHQLMCADRDLCHDAGSVEDRRTPHVTVEHCPGNGYSIVNVRCKDRPKLVLDVLCTLTDSGYLVRHASVTVKDSYALQEFYIRPSHAARIPMSKEEEERLATCLRSAIRRRAHEGVQLEMWARDRAGLLSHHTRVLREHGLSIERAAVIAAREQARSVFYLKDASGDQVDMRIIDALRKEIGQNVKFNIRRLPASDVAVDGRHSDVAAFSFSSFLKWIL